MKISLRKANAAQTRIKELIEFLVPKSAVTINEFEDPNEAINNAHEEFGQHLAWRLELVEALYEIRKLVAAANQKAGINDLLADVAQIEKKARFYADFARLTPRMSEKVIEGKIAKIKHGESDRYSYQNGSEFETCCLEKGELLALAKKAQQLRAEKQKLQDKLLELNFRHEIDLDATTVANLQGWDVV